MTEIFDERTDEQLFDMLFAGVKDVMEHGDFGKLTAAAAARFEIQDELQKRGMSQREITTKVHAMWTEYKES